jgi:hypothetical protein
MKFILTTLTTIMTFGLLTFALPVLAQDACEGQMGAAYGMCISAGHLGCGTVSEENTNVCVKIEDNFLRVTGEMPPWLESGPCNVSGGNCRVFATSERFSSDFGGLESADSQCQRLADNANLNGTFKAWLSSSTTAAKDRLVHAEVPYTLVDDETVVAANWVALTTPNGFNPILDSAINTDEYGQPATANEYYRRALVWTGTTPEGDTQICSSEQPCTCGDWTGTGQTNPGDWEGTNLRWTGMTGGSSNCDKFYNNGGGALLYCFEQ